jgi:hypothetical protein
MVPQIAANKNALAWLEIIAVSARQPMPDKDIKFLVKI